jgi:tetratricopeptide (TPR) repeat protein
MRKYDEAIVKYEKSIELDPGRAKAYTVWGNALSALGKDKEANEKFDKARELPDK